MHSPESTSPHPLPTGAAALYRGDRRRCVGVLTALAGAGGLSTTLGGLALLSPGASQAARTLRPLATVAEGPFYPPAQWRAAWSDWDADLTRVAHRDGSAVARGELLGLEGDVVDRHGRVVDGAAVEIWQCDATATYHHPRVRLEPGRFDPGFAGFGATRSATDGGFRFRTIRPVPYPGRTPHIHLKLRHPTFGEVTSQLFVDGDPGNAEDFLWQRLPASDRPGVSLVLRPAPGGTGLRWLARHRLVVPA
jgi:protocatechuate 3,4-dioxygenase beta subunit